MGCCFSSDDDKTSQQDDITERTRLLGNVVSNTPARPVHNDDYGSRNQNSLPKKGDEQSALNRILHQTATSVIDVSALDSHNLEQHEYMDRARHYNHRLASANFKSVQEIRPCLLADIPAPEKVLSADPVNQQDILLITTAVDKAARALMEVKVQHKEDLVVQFGIP